MGSWAQGELCSCELLMNAAPLGLVVGRASGEASAVFGCGRRGERVGRHGCGRSRPRSRRRKWRAHPRCRNRGAVLLGAKADVTALVGDEGGAEEFWPVGG